MFSPWTDDDTTRIGVGVNAMILSVAISPSILGWDFSSIKNFNMGFAEGHQMQFRFEAFNLPNHPNWGNPDTNAGNPANFGVIGGTRTNMRNLQVALKYIF